MFPAGRSNQITYEYFCVLGGLANPAVFKMERHNGSHIYHTYHLMSVI
jgi:hypothetical protein